MTEKLQNIIFDEVLALESVTASLDSAEANG